MAASADSPAVRIGIVGGGIGGLAAAIALEQNGVEANIYETAATYEPIGAGILLAPNALRALDRLKLADVIRNNGAVIDTLRLFDGSGRPLRQLHLSTEAQRIGEPYVYLHRATLQDHLLDCVDGDRIQLGRTCETVELKGEPAKPTVRFADDTDVTQDAIVGADGVESAVRNALWSVSPRPFGAVTYRGVAHGIPDDIARETWQVWGRATRAGIAPIDDDRVYWFATANDPVAVEEPTKLRQALAGRFEAYPVLFQRVLSRTAPSSILTTTLTDVPPLSRWRRGRITLLGDAAHAPLPYLGQGAAQALEDALVLANRIATAGNHTTFEQGLERALAAYERERRPRANRVLRASRLAGRMAQTENRWLTRLRNGAVRWAPRHALMIPPRWLSWGRDDRP